VSDHKKAIEQALAEKNITQVDLAEKCGVTPQTINKLLRVDARISSINKAAAALGIKTSTLLRKGE
jgi:transcriptional regulator with XRE-family HTH domain